MPRALPAASWSAGLRSDPDPRWSISQVRVGFLPYNAIVDLDIPICLGRNSDGKVFILTLAVASELLEDINRVRRIEI